MQGVRAHQNVDYSQRRENFINRDRIRVVQLLLQQNKQQIMQNNVETQLKHMYLLYIGSLCYVAFPLARLICIVTSQVFVDAMKNSIELCLS